MSWKKNRAEKRQWMQEREAEKVELAKQKKSLELRLRRFNETAESDDWGRFVDTSGGNMPLISEGRMVEGHMYGRTGASILEWSGPIPRTRKRFDVLPPVSRHFFELKDKRFEHVMTVDFEPVLMCYVRNGVEFRWRNMRPVG